MNGWGFVATAVSQQKIAALAKETGIPLRPNDERTVAAMRDCRNSVQQEGSRMSPVVSLIRSKFLSDAAEYAYAATAPADARLIFLAGSCPLDEDGATAAVGDYRGQAAKCIDNMKTALVAAGASIEDVISTRVLVASTEQADLVAAWEVVRDAFGRHDVPSTLMGVTVLGYDDQLVEVEAIAAVRD